MQTSGELKGEKIIVKKPIDTGRLYSKSHFGKFLTGNKLQLDLLEGVFLVDEGKIKIYHNKKELDFQKLVKIAAQSIPEFEIKYLVFKDLRNRGHAVKLCEKDVGTNFYGFKQQFLISVFSERDILDLKETRNLIKDAKKRKKALWFGIVDEEGDITYYEVSSLDIRGITKEHVFPKALGVLLKDRVVIFDKDISKDLLEKEFFGKSFGEGLQLSLIEVLYLSEKGFIVVETADGKKISKQKLEKVIHNSQPDIELRLIVFKDLKERNLIVKTGFKFGAHFRAYAKKPDETHAEYLVHVVEKDFKSVWAEISRAVRLAHSVNKEIVFARIDNGKIDYIKFGRLRP
jgi:tRNA-intron endonuclease